MTENITTIGAEFLAKYIFTNGATKPTDVTVGLFDNQSESSPLYSHDSGTGETTIVESSDVGDITTEPSDGNYGRLTYAFGATDFTAAQDTNSDWQAQLVEKEFDLTDTTGYGDSYFIELSFNAGADSSVTPHLLTCGPLLDTQGSPLRLDLGSTRSFFFSGAMTIP